MTTRWPCPNGTFFCYILYSDERSLFNIYQSINEIDWTRDFFLVYGYNHHPPEVIQQLFADWQLQHLKTYPMQSFYLDIETALNIQIQYANRALLNF